MALDFSKLTLAVHKVADLAHSHASLHQVAGLAVDAEKTAQAEIDSLVDAIEAALGQTAAPLTQAGANGLAAVAVALNPAPASVAAPAPQSPVLPAVSPVDAVPTTVTVDAVPAVSQPAVPPAAPSALGPVTGVMPEWLKNRK
jgi:hypothetical protein